VCFDGFDGKIISLYAGAMTTREIQGHLEEIYGVEVSPGLISAASDAVLEEVRVWQTRPLEAVYPILYLDALIVKVKEQGRVINKSVYLAIGANLQGLKEVLGIWIAETEEARILAGDCDRVANARRRGYSHCLCGWIQRFPGSD
jgi:putative transposase